MGIFTLWIPLLLRNHVHYLVFLIGKSLNRSRLPNLGIHVTAFLSPSRLRSHGTPAMGHPVTPNQQDSLFIQPTPSPPALLPSSLLSPTRGPLFIPDSQEDSSQELSPLRSHKYNPSHVDCTRDKRLQIQTALLFKIPRSQIMEVLDVTDGQMRAVTL
jgi:hypothetical protein